MAVPFRAPRLRTPSLSRVLSGGAPVARPTPTPLRSTGTRIPTAPARISAPYSARRTPTKRTGTLTGRPLEAPDPKSPETSARGYVQKSEDKGLIGGALSSIGNVIAFPGTFVKALPTLVGKAGQTAFGIGEGLFDFAADLGSTIAGSDKEWYTSRFETDLAKGRELGLKGADLIAYAGQRQYSLGADMVKSLSQTGGHLGELATLGLLDTGDPGFDYYQALRRGQLGTMILEDLGNVMLAGRGSGLTGPAMRGGTRLSEAAATIPGARGTALRRAGTTAKNVALFAEQPIGTTTRGLGRAMQVRPAGAFPRLQNVPLIGRATAGAAPRLAAAGARIQESPAPLRQLAAEGIGAKQDFFTKQLAQTDSQIARLNRESDSLEPNNPRRNEIATEIRELETKRKTQLERTGIPRQLRSQARQSSIEYERRRTMFVDQQARIANNAAPESIEQLQTIGETLRQRAAAETDPVAKQTFENEAQFIDRLRAAKEADPEGPLTQPLPDWVGPAAVLLASRQIDVVMRQLDEGTPPETVLRALQPPELPPGLETAGYSYTPEALLRAVEWARGTLSEVESLQIERVLRNFRIFADFWAEQARLGRGFVSGPLPETYFDMFPDPANLVRFMEAQSPDPVVRGRVFEILDEFTSRVVERDKPEVGEFTKAEGSFKKFADAEPRSVEYGVAAQAVREAWPALRNDPALREFLISPEIYPAPMRPLMLLEEQFLRLAREQDVTQIAEALQTMVEGYGDLIGKRTRDAILKDLEFVAGEQTRFTRKTWERLQVRLVRVQADMLRRMADLEQTATKVGEERVNVENQMIELLGATEAANRLIESAINDPRMFAAERGAATEQKIVDDLQNKVDRATVRLQVIENIMRYRHGHTFEPGGMIGEATRPAGSVYVETATPDWFEVVREAQTYVETPEGAVPIGDHISYLKNRVKGLKSVLSRRVNRSQNITNLLAGLDAAKIEAERLRQYSSDPTQTAAALADERLGAQQDFYTPDEIVRFSQNPSYRGYQDSAEFYYDIFLELTDPGHLDRRQAEFEQAFNRIGEWVDTETQRRVEEIESVERDIVELEALEKDLVMTKLEVKQAELEQARTAGDQQSVDRLEKVVRALQRYGPRRARYASEAEVAAYDADFARNRDARIEAEIPQVLEMTRRTREVLSADELRARAERTVDATYRRYRPATRVEGGGLRDQLFYGKAFLGDDVTKLDRAKAKAVKAETKALRAGLKGVGKLDADGNPVMLRGVERRLDERMESLQRQENRKAEVAQTVRDKHARADELAQQAVETQQGAQAYAGQLQRPMGPDLAQETPIYLPGGLTAAAQTSVRIPMRVDVEGVGAQTKGSFERVRYSRLAPLSVEQVADRINEILGQWSRNVVIEDIVSNPQFTSTVGGFLSADVVEQLQRQAEQRVDAQGGIRVPGERETLIKSEFGNLVIKRLADEGYEPISPVKMSPDLQAHAPLGDLQEIITGADVDLNTLVMRRGLREQISGEFSPAQASRMPSILQRYFRWTGAKTGSWKSVILPFSLRWQIGDHVSIVLLSWVRGEVPPAQMYSAMRDVTRRLKDGDQGLINLLFADSTNLPINDPLIATLIGMGLQARGLRDEIVRRLRQQTDSPIGDMELKGLFKTIRRKAFRLNEAQNTIGRAAFAITKLQKTLDDMGRSIDEIRPETVAADQVLYDAVTEAVQTANDTLGAFSELSPFEKNVLRNAFPFWSWIKFINKAAAQLVVDNPDKLLFYGHLGSLVADPDGSDFFDYLKGATPIGKHLFDLSFLNPYADAIPFARNPIVESAETFASLSPAIVLPLQALNELVYSQSGRNIIPFVNVSRPGYLEGRPGTSTRGLGDVVGGAAYLGLRSFGGPFRNVLEVLPSRIPLVAPQGRIRGTDVAVGPGNRFTQGSMRTSGMYAEPRLSPLASRISSTLRTFGIPGPLIEIETARRQGQQRGRLDRRALQRRERERRLSRIGR